MRMRCMVTTESNTQMYGGRPVTFTRHTRDSEKSGIATVTVLARDAYSGRILHHWHSEEPMSCDHYTGLGWPLPARHVDNIAFQPLALPDLPENNEMAYLTGATIAELRRIGVAE